VSRALNALSWPRREKAREQTDGTDSLSPSRTWARFFHGAYVTLARCRITMLVSINSVCTSRREAAIVTAAAAAAAADILSSVSIPPRSTTLRPLSRFVSRRHVPLTMAPSDSQVLSFSLFLRPRSASSSIDTVSRPYGRTPTRPCEIPKANKRSNAKKHLFPILYLTLPAFLPFSILLAAIVSLDAHACPGRACLSHVYP